MRLSSVARTGVLTRSKVLMSVAAIAVGVVSAGTCPGPQFTAHMLGSWFEHCPDGNATFSYIYLLSNPAGVNTAGLSSVCRDRSALTSQGIPCQPEAGVYGDGQVTIEFDWSGVGAFPGCPNPAGFPNGSARLHTHTVAEDGTSVLTSLSYSTDFSSYLVEGAHPYEPTFPPLACDDPDRRLLRVDSSSSSGGSDSLNLTVLAPRISTDCDPESVGELLGLCNGASPIAAITPGRVYMQRGACLSLPTRDLRTPAWTFLADSDAQGHATVSFPTPAPAECVYLGATYRFNGQESPAIAGFLRRGFVNCQDADGDGVTTCDDLWDCDDSNPNAYPGNTEVCDGIDNDCDGEVDEGLGSVTCGKGRCANVIPACSGGVPQTCPRGRPVKPPCGPPVHEEPVPIPVVPVN
ncbi:MAG TPA: putative metal-binding motif-containing protein [Candidatus Polarisedimenticolia bacterium]|jgi:hypothetical protein|nr:putative metal-binding motif-containing protein [Candidatus Polarisedimenticolia bacterium]